MWPVFIINMASNTARMARAGGALDQLGIPFTRFEAVNGRALSGDDLARVYDPVANLRRARHPMIGPEIGCYLSHVELWRQIAAGDAAGGVILEDDFATEDDLAAVLEAVAADRGALQGAQHHAGLCDPARGGGTAGGAGTADVAPD
jgi:glycosyl transferase family 25